MDELPALETMPRIARSHTVDLLIGEGLAVKQKQAKALEDCTKHLKRLRKHRQAVMQALGGMTKDKLDDRKHALDRREEKRAARK